MFDVRDSILCRAYSIYHGIVVSRVVYCVANAAAVVFYVNHDRIDLCSAGFEQRKHLFLERRCSRCPAGEIDMARTC